MADLASLDDDREPRAVATIERRLAAIAERHKVERLPNPATHPLVRETMKGIRRTVGGSPTAEEGLSTEDLRPMVAELGDRPLDVRAILLLGSRAAPTTEPR